MKWAETNSYSQYLAMLSLVSQQALNSDDGDAEKCLEIADIVGVKEILEKVFSQWKLEMFGRDVLHMYTNPPSIETLNTLECFLSTYSSFSTSATLSISLKGHLEIFWYAWRYCKKDEWLSVVFCDRHILYHNNVGDCGIASKEAMASFAKTIEKKLAIIGLEDSRGSSAGDKFG